NNSSHAISIANSILTAKIYKKIYYFIGFEDLKDSESQLNHSKSEVKKLFSFETTSFEISDIEK
ncbi:27900_t:CDS:2, partial [Racocetra persica]